MYGAAASHYQKPHSLKPLVSHVCECFEKKETRNSINYNNRVERAHLQSQNSVERKNIPVELVLTTHFHSIQFDPHRIFFVHIFLSASLSCCSIQNGLEWWIIPAKMVYRLVSSLFTESAHTAHRIAPLTIVLNQVDSSSAERSLECYVRAFAINFTYSTRSIIHLSEELNMA